MNRLFIFGSRDSRKKRADVTRSRALQYQRTEVDGSAALAGGRLWNVKVTDQLAKSSNVDVQLISTGLDFIDSKRSVRLQLHRMRRSRDGSAGTLCLHP